MMTPDELSNITIENPRMKEVLDRIVDTIKLSTEKVAMEERASVEKGSFEELLKEKFETYSETKRESIKESLKPIYEAPKEIREKVYGELGKIDLYKTKNISKAVAALKPLKFESSSDRVQKKKVDPTKIINETRKLEKGGVSLEYSSALSLEELSLASLIGSSVIYEEEVQTKSTSTSSYKKNLELYITRVKCVDETGYGWLGERGDDEIDLGAVTVDEDGDTKTVSPFRVGSSFDDGESKYYNPPKKFTNFYMGEGGENWPKTYNITLALAEKDSGGGFYTFLNKLWKLVEKEVTAAIAAAVGAAIGSAVGPLGTVIGAAVGYAVGKAIDWLINCFKDDIFKPQTIGINVPRMNYDWQGQRRTKHFYGHSGHYYVQYFWKIS